MRALLPIVLLSTLAAASAMEATPVDKAATDAIGKLEKMGYDTMPKRAAVAGAVGLVGGLLVKKTTDLVVTCGVIGGLAVGGACYAGWIKPEQVNEAANKATDQAQGWYESYFGGAAPKIKSEIGKSKVVLSKLYKKAPDLVVGGAVGALVGYRLG